uniref:IS3 family transposase n=1 Tax=unclassified Aeribacillus TaxID=2640495 RepID=UPI00403F86C4
MGNTSEKRKSYHAEFKEMVVELYQTGTPVKQICSEYGLSETTIYKWIRKQKPVKLDDGGSFTPEEFLNLQKELHRLKEENENLKKSYGHIRKEVDQTTVISMIDEIRAKHHYDLKTMCTVLGVPRSTYYQSKQKTESKTKRENRELTDRIRKIHTESKQRYGAPKIHHMLEKEGLKVSLKRVQRLMKAAGIYSIIRKKYRPHSNKGKMEEHDNLLNQDFSTTTINEKWVTDITYIHTLRDGWCYLASVMDLHSRKIVGYAFDRHMTTELALKAVENAYQAQRPGPGLILHSDLGSQYTSEKFAEYMEKKQFKHSFSKKGCPYDNACIESFHAILKKEEIYRVNYLNFQAARRALFEFIEGWYNRKRIHSCLGYMTPQETEDSIKGAA